MHELPPTQRPTGIPEPRLGHDARMHVLRTPLTVAMLQLTLVRRHLRRGDDRARLDAELARIDHALAELATAIAEIDDVERGR